MKKNLYFILIIMGIIFSFALFCIVKINSFSVRKLDFEDIYSTVHEYDYSVLYTNNLNDNMKQKLKSIYKKFNCDCFYSNVSLDDINVIVKSNGLSTENDDVLILFLSGKPIAILDSNLSIDDLEIQFNKYIYNIIPDSEIKYTVPVTAAEYIENIDKNNYVVSVFGAESCSYCNLYLPVINGLATKYNFDYYYIDEDNFEEVEYEKITNLNFTIPGKCTTNGEDTTMLTGFAKPMTIITKKGQFVDCIKGYVLESEVKELLEKYSIIKEK